MSIAAKAVAFGEALRPDFKVYAKNIVENARALAETLASGGFDIVSGGTDNHLMLVDLRPKRADGQRLGEGARPRRPHLQQERHSVRSGEAVVTSGIRLGTPACTTRGFGVAEFQEVGRLIAEVLDAVAQIGPDAQRRGRGGGGKAGARADRPLSDLPELTRRCAVPIAAPPTRR